MKMWTNPTQNPDRDSKVPSSIDTLLKEWANMEFCMDYLVNLNDYSGENNAV